MRQKARCGTIRSQSDRLPDLLRPGLRIVFVGTAPGRTSAASGYYYAGAGNRFWRTLSDVGLTPRRLEPCECTLLLESGIGLTDIAKTTAGMDHEIARRHYDLPRFLATIADCRPHIVAFNGKRAATPGLGVDSRLLTYGRQAQRLAGVATAFVLPSTSGAAGRYWAMRPWQELADAAGALAREPR